MTRREFFAWLNPFRDIPEEDQKTPNRTATETKELFLLAMAQGIDPATVDPDRLPEILGLNAGAGEKIRAVKG